MLQLLAIFVYECIGIELVSAIFYLKSIGIGSAAKKCYRCITNTYIILIFVGTIVLNVYDYTSYEVAS